MNIDAHDFKVGFIISTILALAMFCLIVAFEFFGEPTPSSEKEFNRKIELLLISALKNLDGIISYETESKARLENRIKEVIEESGTSLSQFDKENKALAKSPLKKVIEQSESEISQLDREASDTLKDVKNIKKITTRMIENIDSKIKKYESLRKKLVSNGIEILGSGWLSKKSFQAFKVSNVLTKKEFSTALKKYGASQKIIARLLPSAWKKIKSANIRGALAAIAATGVVVATQEAGGLFVSDEGISLGWKIGLPSGIFVLVFFGFLGLVHFEVLE